MTAVLRGNWEPERSALGWARQPADRTCTLCRRSLQHTKAEHDLLYPLDRAARMERDRAEEQAQAERDRKFLDGLIDGGMTEEQAVDELMRRIGMGDDLT